MSLLRDFHVRVVVSTDLIARGVDVQVGVSTSVSLSVMDLFLASLSTPIEPRPSPTLQRITLVVNLDLPRDPATYVYE